MKSAIQSLLDMPDDLPFEPTPKAANVEFAPTALEGAAKLDSTLARAFVLAGKAVFTVVSKKTGTRFTFKTTRPAEDNGYARRPIWISVLSGPDNNSDYAYLGTIWEDAEKFTYAHGRKSRVAENAPSVVAARWLTLALNYPEKLEQCEVFHEGRCGRCNRRLTVPESIRTGLGPECAGRM